MGGEKPFLFYGGSSDSGSPPHGRGKVGPVIQLRACAGITPAWAGKSAESSGASGRERDHPRVDGEKGSYRWVIKSVKGSPPRGRGKDEDGSMAEPLEGITPA